MSLAGLPMYDLPALSRPTDDWWAGLARAFAREGIADVPKRLERGIAREALWSAPDLLLAQTCGYPLMFAFSGRLAPLAAPSYRAPGAAAGRYCSLIVVPEGSTARTVADLFGTVAALNDWQSHSGMNALRHMVAPHARDGRFFAAVRLSGSHEASLALLRRGRADVAAVDCVSHALLARHVPEALAGTRVLTRSPAAPALPYVTRSGAGDDLVRRLRAGLARATADPALAECRAALLLEGFVPAALDDYRPIVAMSEAAARAGYPRLA